jgi:hypothetical protein
MERNELCMNSEGIEPASDLGLRVRVRVAKSRTAKLLFVFKWLSV